jgi:pimeloyl-ACP methyl ester carboxylesterase
MPHTLFTFKGVEVRKHVYLLIASSVLTLAAFTASGQDRGAKSATQERAAAPAFDPELTNYQYPYPVNFYEFDTQSQKLRMAYMDIAAAKPNGHAVVLLHGKNFSGAYWASTIKALTEAGYRVIAPDHIPRAKLVEIAEAGHLPQVDSFAKYARALLDFIAVADSPQP